LTQPTYQNTFHAANAEPAPDVPEGTVQQADQPVSQVAGLKTEADFNPADAAVAQFPLHIFPKLIQLFIDEVCSALSCVPDLLATPILAVIAAAIGVEFQIQLKPGWLQPASCYLCSISPPGTVKSPAMSFATTSLIDENRFAISTDATTEALALQLRLHQNVFLVHDELSVLFGGLNKYRQGRGSDREFYESAWNAAPLSVSRVRTVNGAREVEKIDVPRPYLTIIGCTQPDRLRDFVDTRLTGFLDRFGFSFPTPCYPHYTAQGIDTATVDSYNDLIRRVSQLKDDLVRPSKAINPIIRFSPEGQLAWDSLATEHTGNISEIEELHRGANSKLLTYAGRFNLILNLASFVAGETSDQLVSAETVEDAFELANYFMSHRAKVFDYVTKRNENGTIQALFEWIVDRGGQCSARDVVTARVAGLRTTDEVVAVFRQMVQARMGHMMTTTPSRGGPKTIWFRPGPSLPKD
jgi:hypothetical protein